MTLKYSCKRRWWWL